MIKNDKLIYSFLILSLIVIIYIFYKNINKNNYEKETVVEKEIINNELDLSVSEKKENIIENIEYYSIDSYGNKFEIRANKAITDDKNTSKIFLEDVKARIILSNFEVVDITSKTANYDKENLVTNFKEQVNIKYLNHKITSGELNLFFKSRFATINENVIYKGIKTNMQTDNIQLDFNNKSSKIFMNSTDKKIKINSKY